MLLEQLMEITMTNNKGIPPKVYRPSQQQYSFDPQYGCSPLLFGIPLIIDENIPGPWEFPKDRFVEYGPEDEWWARKYGFGRELKGKPSCYKIGNKLVCNQAFIHSLMPRAAKAEIKPSYNNIIEGTVEFTVEGRKWIEEQMGKMGELPK